MEKQYGPWKIKNTSQIYKDDFIEVNLNDVIKPDGKNGKYSTVKVVPGIAILALDSDNNVYLTKQFRFAIGNQSLEVICGSVGENEDPFEAAKRELKEEAGITAEEWNHLGLIDTDTSIVNNHLNIYLARNLGFTRSDQDATEEIKIIKYSLQHVVDMVVASEITHAPSCIAVLKANEFLRSSTPKIK